MLRVGVVLDALGHVCSAVAAELGKVANGVGDELSGEAEAADAAARVRTLAPFFDASAFGSRFQRAEDRERLADLLRKAGLGETQPRPRSG